MLQIVSSWYFIWSWSCSTITSSFLTPPSIFFWTTAYNTSVASLHSSTTSLKLIYIWSISLIKVTNFSPWAYIASKNYPKFFSSALSLHFTLESFDLGCSWIDSSPSEGTYGSASNSETISTTFLTILTFTSSKLRFTDSLSYSFALCVALPISTFTTLT